MRNDGICSDPCMSTDLDWSKYLGSCADIDVAADLRDPSTIAANGNLLKDQTVRPDRGLWVNDDPVRMWHQQSPANMCIEWNIGTCYRGPETMFENG